MFIGTIIVALASLIFAKDAELIKHRAIKIGEDEAIKRMIFPITTDLRKRRK
tara:strand:+ start:519 stop:674 length:156 start_codon:yes stop_codon:yes gene_type:complete